MANPVGVHRLLSAWTDYFVQAIKTKKPEAYARQRKWFVMDPSAPAKNATFFVEFNEAEAERKRRENDQARTFGPLCAIFDVSSGTGWNNICPIDFVLATRDKTTIVIRKQNKPHLLEYERAEFTTFLVVVPKDSGQKVR